MSDQSQFPNSIWDGTSESRPNTLVNRSPDWKDWDRIVSEVRSTQSAVLGISEVGQTLYSAEADSEIKAGQPVYFNFNSLSKAVANSQDSSLVAGLVLLSGETPTYITSGKLELPDWTDSTGANELTVGAIYYLHPSIPGRITTSIPSASGLFLVKLGQAQSETELDVNIAPPIRL